MIEFLRSVPTVWDETRLVDGYPGRFVIMARRKGQTGYVAGINGTDQTQTISVDLSFLEEAAWKGSLITDGPRRSFVQTPVDNSAAKATSIELSPSGGLVMFLDLLYHAPLYQNIIRAAGSALSVALESGEPSARSGATRLWMHAASCCNVPNSCGILLSDAKLLENQPLFTSLRQICPVRSTRQDTNRKGRQLPS